VVPPPDGPTGLRGFADQRSFVLSQVEPLMPFGMVLIEALGLQLAERIVSDVDLPGFDNSAMDGYAVRSDDVAGATADAPVTLPVDGVVAAGDLPDALAAGSARKIMTGAPIPDGADTVVAYEQTDRGATSVLVYEGAAPGHHIRRRGSDLTEGVVVADQGTILDARLSGVLAGIGVDKVLVRPRPRVAVISTGSELVEPGGPIRRGQVYDSNSHLIAACAKQDGAQVWRVGLVSDDRDLLRQTIADQLIRADLIVTTGGVSEGDFDTVKQIAGDLGAADFCRVAMQPGKPQGFGLIGDDDVPILMLPGNPVSAFVSYEAFVRPVLRKLMGAAPYVRPVVEAVATGAMRSRQGILQLARGHAVRDGGAWSVDLVGGHGSHLLGDLRRANALVLLDEETTEVAPGDLVSVWLLDE
jgi:molybdopterin molybdotransferase